MINENGIESFPSYNDLISARYAKVNLRTGKKRRTQAKFSISLFRKLCEYVGDILSIRFWLATLMKYSCWKRWDKERRHLVKTNFLLFDVCVQLLRF